MDRLRVVVEYYFDDLEQRCPNPQCDFVRGPYSEEWVNNWCPNCPEHPRLLFYRAFGTEEQRSKPVERWQARVLC